MISGPEFSTVESPFIDQLAGMSWKLARRARPARQRQARPDYQPPSALVTEIKTGSPAAKAGLRADDIILTWGERDVDHCSLPWIVAQTPVGRPTNVTVWRNRAQTQVPVVPEKMPE